MLELPRCARTVCLAARMPSCGRRRSPRLGSYCRTLPSDRECPAVREESQLDDMRSAIRGDFERLAERRGEQELMRVSVDEPEFDPELPASAEDEPPKRSWFARF